MTPTQGSAQPPNPGVVSDRWHLWISEHGNGSYYATRLERLTEDQIRDGHCMTLAADSPEELTRLIREQPDEKALAP